MCQRGRLLVLLLQSHYIAIFLLFPGAQHYNPKQRKHIRFLPLLPQDKN
jgi:hypothetical protein